MTFRAIDPFRAAPLGEFPLLDDDALTQRLHDADVAQRTWRRRPIDARAAFVERVGSLLREQRDQLAEQATREMGKPLVAARAELEKCAALCDHARTIGARALAPERVTEDALGAWRVEFQPLGVVLAIMPWNFPYWQVLRVLVPAVLGGNAVLHKPAPSVPGCAMRLHALLDQAAHETGTPAGLTPLLFAPVQAMPTLIADDRVAAVTLTGSEQAGAAVAEIAGRHLKKVVLELGGSDPFVVLPDADVDRAARAAVSSRMVNTGQSCIAAKRFVVCDGVYEPFVTRLTEHLRALRAGDPMDPRTDIGPLATAAARDRLTQQVEASVAAGARIAATAPVPAGPGFFYPPTLLVDVPDGCPAADDELFGPVASVFRVPDVDAAIARANATRFGLGASVWTRDAAAAARCVSDIACGMLFLNEVVISDPRVPFGGVKRSGIGRELGTRGFREFTNVKTIRVAE
jgi:succinate-semialdehyde dehydrogenase/glutarate-semialdehyde dehydrogenase